MNTDVLRKARIALNVLWVVLAVSFLLPSGPWVGAARGAFVILLAAHALEFLVFHRTLGRLGGSMGHHFVQMLMYGIFHLQLTRAEASEARAEAGEAPPRGSGPPS